MDKRESLIEYQGEINYTVISTILSKLKLLIDQKKEPVIIFKRLLSISDESLENISMYFDKNCKDAAILKKYPSGFKLSTNSESYFITAQNPIKIADIPRLTEKINKINSFTESELKQLYKETISNGKLTEQGGAGLGLLIIAKSSCDKINYTFEQINQELSYFSLNIEISK